MADKTMLNFKYGIFDRLPEAQAPGTVYVTADEKAMYVDLPAVTGKDGSTIAADRIRISQIVVKNNSRDVQPPYSADAFYYFVEENALLKWIPGGGEDGSDIWRQINSVSDVTANLETLTGRVSALETKNTTIEQNIANNKTAIDTLNGNAETAGSVAKAVADAKKAVQDQIDVLNSGEDTAGSIAAAIKVEADRAKLAEKANADEISTLKTTVGGHTSTLEQHLQKINDNAGDITELNNALEALKGTGTGSVAEQISAVKSELIGTAENPADDTIRKAQATADAAASAAATNATAIGVINNTTLPLYVKKDEAPGYGDILTKTAAGTTYATKTELADEKAALIGANVTEAGDGTIHGVYLAAQAAAAAASTADTKAGSAAAAAQTAQGSANAAQATADGAVGRLDVLEGAEDAAGSVRAIAKSYADSKDAAITAAQNAADKAQGEVDSLETKVGQLEASIGNLTNVMNFVGTIDPEITEGYEPGDVGVTDAGKEYVFSDGAWVELGNVTEEQGRLTALENRADALEGIVGDVEAGLVHDVAANAEAISTEATTRGAAIADITKEGGTIDSKINSALTWGTF